MPRRPDRGGTVRRTTRRGILAAMKTGVEFRQSLEGRLWRADAPRPAELERDAEPLSLTLAGQIRHLRRFLLDPTAEVEGVIVAPGLADHRPLRGTVELLPLVRRRIVYDFRFPTNEGREARLHGEGDLDPLRLARGTVRIPATIYVDERETAEAELHLDVRRTLAGLLGSLRRR